MSLNDSPNVKSWTTIEERPEERPKAEEQYPGDHKTFFLDFHSIVFPCHMPEGQSQGFLTKTVYKNTFY